MKCHVLVGRIYKYGLFSYSYPRQKPYNCSLECVLLIEERMDRNVVSSAHTIVSLYTDSWCSLGSMLSAPRCSGVLVHSKAISLSRHSIKLYCVYVYDEEVNSGVCLQQEKNNQQINVLDIYEVFGKG